MSDPQSEQRVWRMHNMHYLRLNEQQIIRHEEIMRTPSEQWPAGLLNYVQSKPGSFSGDALACAIADWIREGN